MEKVWALLSEPSRYSDWSGAEGVRVSPGEPAHAGQVIHLKAKEFGLRCGVVIRVWDVDERRHLLVFETDLPLGMGRKNRVVRTEACDVGSFIQYG